MDFTELLLLLFASVFTLTESSWFTGDADADADTDALAAEGTPLIPRTGK